MRESVGSTTTFKLVLAFTFIFAAFISLAIVYNRAFRLKNESLAIIERYEGINTNSLEIINNYLKNSGYTAKGKCDSDEYGVKDLTKEELGKGDGDYYYCLKANCLKESCVKNKSEIFYEVKLFYKFNLPFIGDLVNFKITGVTKGIKYYNNKQLLK